MKTIYKQKNIYYDVYIRYGGEIMGISMGSATYARDDAGLRRLEGEFQDDMRKARNALRNYNDVIRAIDKQWEGVDAEKFKKNFKETVDQIVRKVNTYETKVLAALDDDARQFRANQSKIASSLSRVNIK
jgi:uncharacterized protein YukE